MSTNFDLPRRAVLSMALGAGVLAFRASQALASDLSPRDFRDLVVAVGARHYPSLPIRPTAADLEVRWGGHHLYLYNVYAEIRVLPPERRELATLDFLARFSPEADAKAGAIVAAAESWDKARALLRPKLYPFETVKSAPRIVNQPFSRDVVIGYAIDLGDKDLYVDQRRVAQWGVSLPQLHATALDNLEAMSTTFPTADQLARGDGRFVMISTNDGYDAARILLPGLRKRLLAALGPGIFAGIPGRDALVVWSPNVERRSAIEALVRAYAARMPHALTGEIFAVDGDGVRPT